MKVTETKLEGCLLIETNRYNDKRGIFQETYNARDFLSATGLAIEFVQDNLSTSKKGVLRGLHFQEEPFAQAKLIQVLKGEVLDVIVDLRKSSRTFGEHLKLKINAEDGRSVYIPKGMAHGFLSLTEDVLFHYKCDSFYNHEAERGIFYNDPDLNIDWEYPSDAIVLSEKDRLLPTFKSLLL